MDKNDVECKLIVGVRNNETDKVIVKRMKNKILSYKMLRETLMRIFFSFLFFFKRRFIRLVLTRDSILFFIYWDILGYERRERFLLDTFTFH